MKTFLTMFCIACSACLLQAQTIKQAEYFIDDDKGAGQNTKLNLAANADSSYTLNINVSGISNGLHKLYIRTKDNQGKWSLTAQQTIEIIHAFEQEIITTGEYFFDADPGYGNGKKITVSNVGIDITEDFTAAAALLTSGYHALYTRFVNDNGKWSITNKRNIEIVNTADTTKIVAAEYFFTGDKSFGKATRKIFASTAADSTFKFKIPYKKIPAGADSLFIRMQDNNGNWSTTKIAVFHIQSILKDAIADDANSIKTNFNLQVFPNPSTDKINLVFQSENKTAFMQLLSEDGKTLLQKTVTPGVSNTINISALTAGIYIVQINDGGILKSIKFIKQ